jgi:hypothetical protein
VGVGGCGGAQIGGVIPVGMIFKASIKIGRARANRSAPLPTIEEQLRILSQ